MAFPFQGIGKSLVRGPCLLRLHRRVILAVKLHGENPQAVLACPRELCFFIRKQQLTGAIRAVQRMVSVRIGFAAKSHDRSSSSARSAQSRTCSPGWRWFLKFVSTRVTYSVTSVPLSLCPRRLRRHSGSGPMAPPKSSWKPSIRLPSSLVSVWLLRSISATWVRAQEFGQPLSVIEIGTSKSPITSSKSSTSSIARDLVVVCASLQNSRPVQLITPRRNSEGLG